MSIDLENFEIDEPFNFEMFETETIVEKTKIKQAVAHKTRSRIHARRAKSEAVLAEILPATIETGDSWHVLSSGDIDSLSFLAHILRTHKMEYVAFSTWCMAMEDVRKIKEWLNDGIIGRVDAYVGEIFPNQYSDEYAALCETVRHAGGRVAVFRNHSKIFLCRAGLRYWVVESSANINTNPRTENTIITADEGLYQHHLAYFDGIHSFTRDFDDWAPITKGIA